MAAEGKDREKGVWGRHVTLLYLKCITNKILLYSMGNSAQCFVAVTWMWIRGESLEENGYIHTYV